MVRTKVDGEGAQDAKEAGGGGGWGGAFLKDGLSGSVISVNHNALIWEFAGPVEH